MIVKIIREITLTIDNNKESLKKGDLWCLPHEVASQLIDECYAVIFYGKVNSIYKEKYIPTKKADKIKTVKDEGIQANRKHSKMKRLINTLLS